MKAPVFSVSVAFILWFAVFVLRPFNFWLMMSANALVLSLLAIRFSGWKIFSSFDFSLRNAALGILSALILYGIFFAGDRIAAFLGLKRYVNMIYADRGSLPGTAIAFLLAFPIGFAEELFWRGFIQGEVSARKGKAAGFAAAALAYTFVHVSTVNPVLIAASAVCGVFWGALYAFTGSLTLVAVSHMLWSPLVFVFAPFL